MQIKTYAPEDGAYVSGWQSEHRAYPFRISARDLARFGLLFLRKDGWNGRQIVPEPWVAESTRSHSDAGNDRGYGYMWWTGPDRFQSLALTEPIFYAAGYRRQYAFVFPGRDLVIVHRINSEPSRTFPPWRQIESLLWYIFAAAGETTIGPSRAIEDVSGVRLTGAALSEQLPGTTLSGTHRRCGNPFRVTFMGSGALSAVAGANGEFQDSGDWRIDGDQYCQEYDKWIGRREFCYNVIRDGDLFKQFDSTGTFVSVLSVSYD